MATTESIPFKYPGDSITAKASAIVAGRRFVSVSGNRTGGGAGGLSTDPDNLYQVAQSAAGAAGPGVSAYDAAATGKLKVWSGPGMIVPVTAGAAITAGQEVQSDATGQAIPLAAGRPRGLAMTGAASGAVAEIRIY